jgi:leucyl/phenylalanyl-tRNA---protein transferase
MEACADRPEDAEGTWISGDIIESYVELHRLGLAHSVETWQGDRLVGGLYGVSRRGAFFGESMFSRETDASKCALVVLARYLRSRGFTMIDGQLPNPHLERLGAVEMRRNAFLVRIADDAAAPDPVGRWNLPPAVE